MKGIVIRSSIPSPPSSSSSESNLLKRILGRHWSGPSIPVSERLVPALEEELTVDQPGSPRPAPDDLQLVVADKPTVEEVEPVHLELGPSVIIPVEELGVERQGSPPHEPDSLALVVVDSPAEEGGLSRSL